MESWDYRREIRRTARCEVTNLCINFVSGSPYDSLNPMSSAVYLSLGGSNVPNVGLDGMWLGEALEGWAAGQARACLECDLDSNAGVSRAPNPNEHHKLVCAYSLP